MSIDNGKGTKIIPLNDMKPPTCVSWNLTPFSLEETVTTKMVSECTPSLYLQDATSHKNVTLNYFCHLFC